MEGSLHIEKEIFERFRTCLTFTYNAYVHAATRSAASFRKGLG